MSFESYPQSHCLLPDLHCSSFPQQRDTFVFSFLPCIFLSFAIFSQLHDLKGTMLPIPPQFLSHLASHFPSVQFLPPRFSHALPGLELTADQAPLQHWFPSFATAGHCYSRMTWDRLHDFRKYPYWIDTCFLAKQNTRPELLPWETKRLKRVCVIATQFQRKLAPRKTKFGNSPLTLTKEKMT